MKNIGLRHVIKLLISEASIKQDQQIKSVLKSKEPYSVPKDYPYGNPELAVILDKAKTSSDPKELSELSSHENSYVRRYVADNKSTPVQLLATLSKDEDWNVRSRVALNPRTPKDVLDNLSSDKDENVRWKVSMNPSTGEETLMKLKDDKSDAVKDFALNNNKSVNVESLSLKEIISLKEEFDNSFEIDAEAPEEEWHKAEPDYKVNWDKQLSLGSVFGAKTKKAKKKEDKKEDKSKKLSMSFLVIKDKK